MTPRLNPPQGVLFDLDGTLLDTAPDLAAALNHVRTQQGLPRLSFAQIRPHVSHGSAALIKIGGDAPQSGENFAAFQQALLQVYAANVACETRLFEGMDLVLQELERRSRPWGVVTNKPRSLTTPLMRQLGLDRRAKIIVSGDTIAQKKPHPAPLLLAAGALGVAPHRCLYVGDAERDIVAGKAAGMQTVTALYGYIAENEFPEKWDADATISCAADLIPMLLLSSANVS